MCGICGVISRHMKPEFSVATRRMSEAMTHRGPDSSGAFDDTFVSLAMRRLSIIDLGGGQQPLFNEDRSLVLVVNGEIYNYIELQEDLEARGHKLRTQSDGETILHLYEEFGVDCLRHLRGMFAFALWDAGRRRLFIARDRVGEKPLYLYTRDQTLFFSSELKALLASREVPRDIDAAAVDQYLHYQYTPEPRTMVKGVHKLAAGSFLTIDVEHWRVDEQRYWDIANVEPLNGDPAERIRAELETVAKLVIRSDVPVGISLSGGVDSSAVAALAASAGSAKLAAFTVGYPGRPGHDERHDAHRFAETLGIPFFDVELTSQQVVGDFPKYASRMDEPVADIAAPSIYAVMQLAQQHNVKVLLGGLGGDELFWGYSWMRQIVYLNNAKFSRLEAGDTPKWARSTHLEDLVDHRVFRRLMASKKMPVAINRWLRHVAHLRDLSLARKDSAIFVDASPDFRFSLGEVPHLLSAEFRNRLDRDNAFVPGRSIGNPQPDTELSVCKLVYDNWLVSDCLVLADRLSMAASVENRSPFVDHVLIETVMGLRKKRSDLSLPAKAWLHQAIGQIVPQEIFDRPKRGFEPPVQEWLSAIVETYRRELCDSNLVKLGIISHATEQRIANAPPPTGAHLFMVYKLLLLEAWCETVLCGPG